MQVRMDAALALSLAFPHFVFIFRENLEGFHGFFCLLFKSQLSYCRSSLF